MERAVKMMNVIWCSFWSENNQREYYFNTQTENTCWTRSHGVEIDVTAVTKTNPEAEVKSSDTNSVVTNKKHY